MSEEHQCPHHHHHHGDECQEPLPLDKMDTADKSLADALRISFIILKVIMVIVVVAFIASGFQTIGPDEQGLVLRFGKIQTVGSDGDVTLDPGLKWIFPYPIDEIVKIPVEKRINVAVNSFWYYMTADEVLNPDLIKRRRPSDTLDPTREGYTLTRGERLTEGGESEGNDYNIVHSKWQIVYKIKNPRQFFTNVYVRDLVPGDTFQELMEKDIKPLLVSCFEEAVVTAMVHYTIDEALESKGLGEHVKRLVQQKLDTIESGLSVQNVTLDDIVYPRQIETAFDAFITATQQAKAKVNEAQTKADVTLTQTAGGVARELADALRNPNTPNAELDSLWAGLAGNAQEIIAEANAYRSSVVAAAESTADYFNQLLPEYKKHPELVVKNLYLDAVQSVMNGIDEKFVMQGDSGDQSRELRIQLNRDPALKRSKPVDPNQANAAF